MKIVTSFHGIQHKFSDEKIIEMLSCAGFDGIDFDDIPVVEAVHGNSYKEYAKHLCNVAENFGVSFRQAHAPISGALLKELDGNTQIAADKICRSIEFAQLLGADNIVVHPIQKPIHATDPEQVFEENMEFFSKLVPCAEGCGIKLAIENMMMPSFDGSPNRAGVCADPVEFKRYIDYFDSKFVTGCLDFGHSAVSGREPQDMLRAMGSDYITSTHIHDNDFASDCHQLPYTMKMNWDEICRAMADIGYSGDFTLECICFYDKFSEALLPEAFKFMYKTAEHLVNKIEKYKM